MITVSNFKKAYGPTTVLDIRHLHIKAGVAWIKGENGSGKSTFFKSLSGLIPFNGNVTFDDGLELTSHPVEYRKRVGFSEAEPLYPGFLTGKEIFNFVGKARKISASEIRYYQALFGIYEYFDKPCETYSSGMLKKLSLSLAFLGKPSLIILDEPLITLDQESCEILLNEIASILKERKTLFLLSSHQLLHSQSLQPIVTYEIKNKSIVQH